MSNCAIVGINWGVEGNTAWTTFWYSYMHYLNIQAGGRDASRSNPNQKKILSSRKKLSPAAHF